VRFALALALLALTCTRAYGQENAAPVAVANGPYSGVAGSAIQFSSAGSTDSDGSLASFGWAFGDGGSSTEASPQYAYAVPGTFTATLTVTDDDGATASATTSVTVSAPPNQAPQANANGPYTGTTGQPVAFSSAGSADADGSIASYGWTFGDGTTGSGASPSHAYAEAGTFTATLTVTDDDGATASATTSVTISAPPNQPPRANANGPYTGTAGQPVAFSSAGSTDPDGSIATYAWTFGDGSTGSGASPSHAYAAAGTFTVTLTVTDDDGATASATASVTIAAPPNQPPRAAANGPYTGIAGEPVAFSSVGSADPDGSIASYRWTFGDGSTGSGASPSHSYTAAGTFTATLTVTDDDGATASGTASVTIAEPPNQPPVAAPDSYRTDEDRVLRVGANDGVLANDDDPDDDDLRAELLDDVENGTLTLERSGAFVYTPASEFSGADSFTYRVTDGTDVSAAATVAIEIRPQNDPPRGTVPDQSATENLPLVAPLDLAALFSDPEGDTVSFSVSGLPPGLSATAGGLITGAPLIVDSVGDWSVRVVATDSGTPPAETVAVFDWRVLAAGRADLSVAVRPAPATALVGATAVWTYTISNASQLAVGNIALAAEFAGAPFTLGALPAGCASRVGAAVPAVDCGIGPLAPGASVDVAIPGSVAQSGDVFATGEVQIADPNPLDESQDNNLASASLGIAASIAMPAQTIAAADHVASTAADFDGDGHADLAVATSAGVPVLIYVNVPDPSNSKRRLLAASPVAVGSAAASVGIATADFDGDGVPDLVTAGGATGPNELLLNDTSAGGSVEFTRAGSVAAAGARAVAVGDLDGNGSADIVFASEGPRAAYAYFGGALTPIALSGSGTSVAVAVTDLGGDPLPEIVFVEADGNARVYPNAGGVFRAAIPLAVGGATSVVAADFDGDGRTDLAFGAASMTAGSPPATVLYKNVSTGAALEFALSNTLVASTMAALAAEDVDGNGTQDLVAIGSSGSHRVYGNAGAAQFAERPSRFETGSAMSVALARISADARDDVIVTGVAGTSVFFNDGRGNFGLGDTVPPVITLLGPAVVNLQVGAPFQDPGATATDDLDGDLSSLVTLAQPLDTAIVGDQTISYVVADSSGNAAAPVTRTVRIGVNEPVGGGGGGATGPLLLMWLLILSGLTLLGGGVRTRAF
jgi:PKD repeat protein